jgi:hypothetical protein
LRAEGEEGERRKKLTCPQSDSADLLGGFKPVELRILFAPLKKKFDALFVKTFSKTSNSEFISRVNGIFNSGQWLNLLRAFKSTLEKVEKLFDTGKFFFSDGAGFFLFRIFNIFQMTTRPHLPPKNKKKARAPTKGN